MSSPAAPSPITPARFAEAISDLPLSALHIKVLELRNSIAHLDYSNEQLRPFAEGRDKPLSSASSSVVVAQAQQQQQQQQQPPPAGQEVVQAEEAQAEAQAAIEPDQDCVDAIRENEQVIARMQERIRLVRTEVEEKRGQSWDEFRSTEEINQARAQSASAAAAAAAVEESSAANGESPATANDNANDVNGARGHGHGQGNGGNNPWTDGTFQTGVVRDGRVLMDNDDIAQPSSTTTTATTTTTTTTTRQPGGTLTDEELRQRVEEQMRGLGRDDDSDEGGGMHL